MVEFPPLLRRDATFVLPVCFPVHQSLLERCLYKRKNLLPIKESKFFPCKVEPFSEGRFLTDLRPLRVHPFTLGLY